MKPTKRNCRFSPVSFAVTLAVSAVVFGQAAAQSTYVYVGNYSGNSVSGYSMNPATGALNAVPASPFAAGTNPGFVNLDPSCKFAYTTNFGSSNVSAYNIDASSGSLTQMAGSPFPVVASLSYSGMDHQGKFLYVPNRDSSLGGTTVTGFSIAPTTGALSPIPGSPFTTGGTGPGMAVVDPSNKFLYVSNDSTGDVSGFLVNPSTGSLTSIAGSPWPSGLNPRWLAIDHTGKFLYVSNTVSGNISVFGIDQSTGSLAPVAGSPIPVVFNIYDLVIDRTNSYAYLGSYSGIFGFSINTATGLLTALPGFPIHNESPQGNPTLAVDPTGQFLLANNQSTNAVGVWKIDGSGGLTQIPASPFATGAAPNSVAVCALPQIVDTTGPITTSVSITPDPLAINTGSSLSATVSDATTGGSNVGSAAFSINGGTPSQMLLTPGAAVTTQASASLAPFSQSNVYNVCVHGTDAPGNTGADSCILLPVYDPSGGFVTGGGQINSPAGADLLNPAAAGKATFGFVSKYLPGRNTPSGNLEFQFKDGNLDFKSTSMDWLVVTGEPRAKFHGIGTVNGTNVCNFEVDAWAGSFTGNADAFGLKITSCSNGGDRYSLPATALTHGSIIIHK